MAFIDELHFRAKAGKGGDGIVSWLREKFREFGGPDGGNGGRGGDVYVRGVRDYAILSKYPTIKEFAAGDGERGGPKSMWGKNGKDYVLDVPVGSVITNLTTNARFEILKEGELVFLLKGGKGGYGNEHFKASTNVSPEQFTLGRPGEEAEFFLEVQMIVDLGFVGFPNAGKSSLLNSLTNAHAKVGAYQFTTLEPNLGALFEFIIADIPGLIEGASEGKGLGYKFLRHIARTKMILHCISLENEDIIAAHKTIKTELAAFSPELAQKQEVILLTKTDTVSPEVLAEKMKEAKRLAKHVFALSILDDASLKSFKDEIVKIMRANAPTQISPEAKKIEDKFEDEHPGMKHTEAADSQRFVSQSMPTTALRERFGRLMKKVRGK